MLISSYGQFQDSTFTKDSAYFYFDFDPVELTISTEPIEKNQALQSVLEQQADQSMLMDENMRSIDRTISKLPSSVLLEKEKMIQKQGIDLKAIASRRASAMFVGNILLGLFLILFLVGVSMESHTVWKRRERTLNIIILVSGIFFFRVLIPFVILSGHISDIIFWDMFKCIF